MSTKSKRIYLETMGCQMNVLDSELVMGQLINMGYEPTDEMGSADVVLFNTCSVREHAEEKAYSKLGQMKKPKAHKPDMIVGVIGCMAERDTEGIISKMPHVDLICGPGQLNHIPAMISEVEQTRHKSISLSTNKSRRLDSARRSALQYDTLEALDLSRNPQPGTRLLQSYIRIQRGCDKFCTFCVVPFTRGPECSRPPQAIVDEAKKLADYGTKEVTLLGQTVNSYAHLENGRRVVLSDLLCRLQDIDGIGRIRFVTSFPGDFSDDILHAMRDLSKVCEYLHIPVQSGSNAVLQRMKRQYSTEQFVDLMHRAREIVLDVELASDFIVGFSGETDAEFAESLRLVEHLDFKNIFCFKYSARPSTAADRNLPDDVSEKIKRERNGELLRVQERISFHRNQKRIGQSVEILVEGYSKAAIKAQEAEHARGAEVSWRRTDQLVGRTRGDLIVVFNGDESFIGQVINVRIVAATALTLHAVWDNHLSREKTPVLPVIQRAS